MRVIIQWLEDLSVGLLAGISSRCDRSGLCEVGVEKKKDGEILIIFEAKKSCGW